MVSKAKKERKARKERYKADVSSTALDSSSGRIVVLYLFSTIAQNIKFKIYRHQAHLLPNVPGYLPLKILHLISHRLPAVPQPKVVDNHQQKRTIATLKNIAIRTTP